MGPGWDQTCDPWICNQTRISCQTRYRLGYADRLNIYGKYGSMYKTIENLITYTFENLFKNFIFANSAKRHICHVKNLQMKHDLPTSVNSRVISGFARVSFPWNFTSPNFRKNKTATKDSDLQYIRLYGRY